MEVHEKLKFIRLFRSWSQEEMAKRLHMHAKGYAKIERGEVDMTLSRLKQISRTLGIELRELVGLDEKNVVNFIEHFHSFQNFIQSNHGIVEQNECKHELEKAYLIIEQKDKEIAYLQEINELLRKEIESLRK